MNSIDKDIISYLCGEDAKDEIKIGILQEDDMIRSPFYQLLNIHEFVKAFYLTNKDVSL